MLYYDKLRYRLLPYLYALVGKTYLEDYTIMRGLAMDFADEKAKDIDDQFMLGPSLLVNPVYEYKARARKVYLPASSGWYDLQSGTYYDGNQIINANAPFSTIPVFVKEGSIIPFGPPIQYTGEKKPDPITLFVYAGKDGRFELYEDNGTTYDYERGQFSKIALTYSDASNTLIIGKRVGAFKGMIKQRTFRVIKISKDRPRELNIDSRSDIEIKYDGSERSIMLK
jgi:alpha-D-xyloside xylohydrolase